MEWKVNHFPARPARPARVEQTANGPLPFAAMPARPARDVHYGTIEARAWDDVERELAEFWVRVCDVLPEHYAAAGSPPAWDRIVLELDVLTGKVMALLRDGEAGPSFELERVTVEIRIPHFWTLGNEMEAAGHPRPWDELTERLIGALARAAAREPARSRLADLSRWRPFALYRFDEDGGMHLLPDPVPAV